MTWYKIKYNKGTSLYISNKYRNRTRKRSNVEIAFDVGMACVLGVLLGYCVDATAVWQQFQSNF